MMAFLFFALLLTVGFPAWGQDAKGVGVVTSLTGKADLKRPQAPQVPLKLRDNLYVRDVVDTHEKSLARILLMGKSSVTVRELSRFEVREETRPDGTQRALIDLATGRIRVMVAQRLMKPGDEVQIRIPNAVASVRGSDGVIEAITLPDGRPQTTVLVASGKFEVAMPSTRPIALAETVVSDAPAGLWVAQAGAVFNVGPGEVLTATGPWGLQQVVQRFDPGAVNAAFSLFKPDGVASGTGATSEPNEAAILATMEALAQFQTTATGEQPGLGVGTGVPFTTTPTTFTPTGLGVITPLTGTGGGSTGGERLRGLDRADQVAGSSGQQGRSTARGTSAGTNIPPPH